MTRGGNRNPLGRPKSKGETKTANLCGVRVFPSKLAKWKACAAGGDLNFTDWVEIALDEHVAATEEFVKRIERLRRTKAWPKE